MPHNVRAITISALAVAATLLAGCSSDSSGGTSSSSTADSTATSSSSSSSSQAATPDAATLRQALITATDLGTGFKAATSQNSDDPLPCTPNDPPLFTQVKPAAHVQQQFGNSADTLAVGEDVAVFDSTDAKTAFAAAVKGFSCSSGTIAGTKITIVKRPNSGGSQGDTESAAWDFTDGTSLGTAAILRFGNKIAAMSFAAKTKANANDINVNTILTKAGTKLATLG